MRATLLVSVAIGVGVGLGGLLLSSLMVYATAHVDVTMLCAAMGIIVGAVVFTYDRRTGGE